MNLIIAEQSGGVALIRTLEVIQRAEVVSAAIPGDELIAFDGKVGVAEIRNQGRKPRRGAGTSGSGQAVAAGVQRTGAEIAAVLGDGIDVPIAEVAGDIAPAVFGVGAHGHIDTGRGAVRDVVRRLLEAGIRNLLLYGIVALVVLVTRILPVELKALVIRLHDEIDDSGHGIRAVGRGGAAGEQFDPLAQNSTLCRMQRCAADTDSIRQMAVVLPGSSEAIQHFRNTATNDRCITATVFVGHHITK